MSYWYNDLSEDQAALANTGVFSKSATPGADSTLAAWDLGSIDYNAAGGQGWVNRIIGLTGLVNPLAWAGTIQGAQRRENANNPDGGFLEKSWNGLMGTLGGQLGGLFEGTNLVEQAVKGTILSAGSVAQNLAQGINGTEDDRTLEDDLANAWDLSITKEVGTAESFVWASGQAATAGNAITSSGMSLQDRQQRAAQAERIASEWGFGYSNSSFNIFDAKQSAQAFDGNWLVQFGNFASTVALDPLNLIPVGAVGKGLLYARRGLESAVDAADDIINLTKIAEGGSSSYDEAMDYIARTDNVGELQAFAQRNGVRNPGLWAEMQAKVKTRQEAAVLELLLQHGSAKAAVEVAQRFGNTDNLTLLADRAFNGGYAARLQTNPLSADELASGAIQNEEYLNAISDLLNTSDDATFVKDLQKALFTTQAGANGTRQITLNAIGSNRNMKFARGFELKMDRLGSEFKNWQRGGVGSDEYVWVTRANKYLPAVVNVIRRGGLNSARGIINLHDSEGVAADKFVGWIDNIDKISNGAIRSSGKTEEWHSAIRRATTPEERLQIATEIQDAGWNVMKDRYNFGDEDISTISKIINDKFNNMHSQLKERGFYGSAADGTIYHDPIWQGQTDNFFGVIDFERVDKFLKGQGQTRINTAVKTKGEALGEASVRSTISGTKNNLLNAKDFANTLWAFGILNRPARVARDFVQGMAGVVLSGHIVPFLQGQSYRRALSLARYAPDRIQDTVSGLRGKSADDLRRTAASYDTDYAAALTLLREGLTPDEINALTKADLDTDLRAQFEQADISLTAETGYHQFNGQPFLGREDSTRPITTSNSTNEAKKFAQNFSVRHTEIDDLGFSKEDIDLINEASTTRTRISAQTVELAEVKRLLQIDRQNTKVYRDIARLDRQIAATVNPDDLAILQARRAELSSSIVSNPSRPALETRLATAQQNLTNLKTHINKLDTNAAGETINLSGRERKLAAIREDLAKQAETGVVQLRFRNDETATWRSATPEEIRAKGNNIAAYEVRTNKYPTSPPVAYTAYGKTLDLHNPPEELLEVMGVTRKGVNGWIKNRNWENNLKVQNWAEENGYGKIAFKEGDDVTTLFMPRYTVTPKYDPLEDLALANVLRDQDKLFIAKRDQLINNEARKVSGDDFDISTMAPTNEALAEAQKTMDRIFSPNISLTEKVAGFRQAVSELNRIKTSANELRSAAAAMEARAARIAPSAGHTGFNYRNQEVDAAFAGSMGGVYENTLTNASRAYGTILGTRNTATGADMVHRIVNPDEDEYLEAFAATLNSVGGTDPVFKMFAFGATDDDAIRYLSKTPEGRTWAQAEGIGQKFKTPNQIKKAGGRVEGSTVEEHVSLMRDIFTRHASDVRIAQMLREERNITATDLQEIFAGREALLQPIDGAVVVAANRKGATAQLSHFMDQTTKIFSSIPQTVMQNHPMFVGLYNRKSKNLIDIALANGERKLLPEELNAIREAAMEDSLREMKRWIYNVENRTNFEEAVSQVVPFFTAYTFTVKMFAGALKENPGIAMWILSQGHNTVGKMNWVDQNGEPTEMGNATAIQIPVAPEIRDVLAQLPWIGSQWADAQNINLSAKSLDMWFGGEIVPGPGPIIALPMNMLAGNAPEVAAAIDDNTEFFPGGSGLFEYALPFGATDNPAAGLIPGWLNNLRGALFADNSFLGDPRFAETLAQITVYKNAEYQLALKNGETDAKPPTAAEIEAEAREYYLFKTSVSALSPVSFQIQDNYTIAAQQYRQYQRVWGEEAGYRFYADNPELSYVMGSANGNSYGLPSSVDTVAALKKYPELANKASMTGDAGQDMLAWAVGVKDADWDNYDRNASVWLANNGPQGGGENFTNTLTPAELQHKVDVAPAWATFMNGLGVLQAQAEELNTTVEDHPQLKQKKANLVAYLKQEFPAWGRDYGNFDAGKYNDRAEFLATTLSDPQWIAENGDRDVVNSLYMFLTLRANTQAQLQQKKASGGTGSIDSDSNVSIAQNYRQQVQQLINGSVEFGDFYSRYFDGDTLSG